MRIVRLLFFIYTLLEYFAFAHQTISSLSKIFIFILQKSKINAITHAWIRIESMGVPIKQLYRSPFKIRIALFICTLLIINGVIFIGVKRNQYNMVSHKEIITIREKLKQLDQQDREDLARFLHQMVALDQFSYTLVGYKPMSISHVIVEDTDDLSPCWKEAFKTPNYQTLRRGYLVWKKYQSLFLLKQHLLIDYSFLGKGRREIALISPKLCMSKIQENLEGFQEILGKSYTTEEVFGILTHPEHNDFYAIVDHTRLIGILLGFGRHNACLFEQYRGGASRSDISWNRPTQDNFQMFSCEWPLPWVQLLPEFVCDPSSKETQELKKHYKKARQHIRWTYFFRNKFEVTLALLEQAR